MSGAVSSTDPEAGLRPPAEVLAIARRLTDAGFETWCVGGAVRDALLGLTLLDWDLATAAPPERVQRLFPRTVPVGIRFGTVGVLDGRGHLHEVTTFRRDVKTDGRHAEVEFGVSLDDDLARRDFTINAIAWDPIGKRLHDPFGGRADLAAGLVRAVGEPAARMREDRLRALRALRFAARFGFALDAATWDAIAESAPHLGRLSPERVKQELDKTMEQVARPSAAFALWQRAGAFATLVPPLAEAPERVLRAVDAAARPGRSTRPQRRDVRHAALFSDVPDATLGKTLRDLRFSNQEIAAVSGLVSRWQALGPDMTAALSSIEPPDDARLRRWAAAMGRLRIGGVMRLAAARWAAARALGEPAPTPLVVASTYRRLLRIAFRDPLEIADLAVGGEDLQRLGARGPLLGRTLQALVAFVLDDPARNERGRLLAESERLLADAAAARGGAS